MGDAGGEHAGLAGAGAGQHEQRAVERLDRLALLGIERVEIVAGRSRMARCEVDNSASSGAGSAGASEQIFVMN